MAIHLYNCIYKLDIIIRYVCMSLTHRMIVKTVNGAQFLLYDGYTLSY